MAHLPFKTGHLSTMSQQEMLSLANELQRLDFWGTEEGITRAVDQYIQRYWRHTASTALGIVANGGRLAPQPYIASTVYKDIRINVPDALDERDARLFAEIQIREQLDPTFDPTED